MRQWSGSSTICNNLRPLQVIIEKFVKRIRSYIVASVFCLLSFPATAQVPELINDSEFRLTAKTAVDSIYNFNAAAADRILEPWKEDYPDHPIWTLFEGMKFWWEILSDLENTAHDEQFYHMMKKADYESSQLLRSNSSHADGLIIKAISNGYLARQHANREEWIRSLNYGRKAMNAHEYLLELQPDLDDLKLAEGLKLYYLDYLPEAYPVVKTVSWTLPNGDREKGLEYLSEASEEAVFARAEATYFLGNINHNYEKNYKVATESFEQLYDKYPNNNYYLRLLVKNYYRMNSYRKALRVIDTALDRWERHSLPHKEVLQEDLNTWKGRILERTGQKNQALESYRRALELGRGSDRTRNRSRHVLSAYSAGKLLYQQGNHREAKTYLQEVMKSNVKSPYKEKARELLSEIN